MGWKSWEDLGERKTGVQVGQQKANYAEEEEETDQGEENRIWKSETQPKLQE